MHRTINAWRPVYNGNTSADSLTRITLTPDGPDDYSVAKYGADIRMSAYGSNVGRNLRQVFWPSTVGFSPAVNIRSVAAWRSDSTFDRTPILQQGLAVRIATVQDGWRALTVTKNIWGDTGWVFNAHMWDTRWETPFQGLAQWDMAHIVTVNGGYRNLPWKVALQVIDQALMFKVWVPAVHAEPGWDNIHHVRMVGVPSSFVYSGYAGWYVGHIPAGETASYNELEIHQYT